MVVKIELGKVSVRNEYFERIILGNAHLKSVVTHLEHNNMLHTEVFLYPAHSFRSLGIFKSVVVLAVKSIHDVSFEMFKQVDLALEVFGVAVHSMRLADIDRPAPTRRDGIEMPVNA